MSSSSSITGKAAWWGTPALSFMYLDPENPAYAELINKVKAGNIKNIDESTFALNVDKKTCNGFQLSVSVAPVAADGWAKGKFEKEVEKENVDLDAVLLVFYYNEKGYCNKYSDKNPAANVKRIGILYIKKADFKLKEGSTTEFSASSITFDMYWQKQDYDYLKVPVQ